MKREPGHNRFLFDCLHRIRGGEFQRTQICKIADRYVKREGNIAKNLQKIVGNGNVILYQFLYK